MTAIAGSTLMISIRDDDDPTVYPAVGGLERVTMRLASEPLPCDALGDDGWRRLLAGSGPRSLTLGGQGRFTRSDAETQLFSHALAGSLVTLRLQCDDGQRIEGDFAVTRYQRDGNQESEITVALTLESAGTLTRFSA